MRPPPDAYHVPALGVSSYTYGALPNQLTGETGDGRDVLIFAAPIARDVEARGSLRTVIALNAPPHYDLRPLMLRLQA
jgi:hypothetical protein